MHQATQSSAIIMVKGKNRLYNNISQLAKITLPDGVEIYRGEGDVDDLIEWFELVLWPYELVSNETWVATFTTALNEQVKKHFHIEQILDDFT